MSTRSRSLLHKNKLKAFRAFCEQHGWRVEPNKGVYDALRMRHPNNREPMIVYWRGHCPEHLTVYGVGLDMVRAFTQKPKPTHADRESEVVK